MEGSRHGLGLIVVGVPAVEIHQQVRFISSKRRLVSQGGALPEAAMVAREGFIGSCTTMGPPTLVAIRMMAVLDRTAWTEPRVKGAPVRLTLTAASRPANGREHLG